MDCIGESVRTLKMTGQSACSANDLIFDFVNCFRPILLDYEGIEDALKSLKLTESVIECEEIPNIGYVKEQRFPISKTAFLFAFEVILFLDMVRVLSDSTITYDVMTLSEGSGEDGTGIINIVVESHRFEFFSDHCVHSDLSNLMEPRVSAIKDCHQILQHLRNVSFFANVNFFEKISLMIMINSLIMFFFQNFEL